MKRKFIKAMFTFIFIQSSVMLCQSQITPTAIRYTTDPNDPITIGNGDLEDKELLGILDFDRVVIGNGFTVLLSSNHEESYVSIRAESNILPYIDYKVIEGQLILGLTESIDTKEGILIKLSVNNLSQLTIKEGANFELDMLDLGELSIVVKSGSYGFAKFDNIKELNLIVMGGSELEASGYIESSNLVIKGGSHFQAKKLKSKHAKIDVLGGSSSSLKVLESVSAKVGNKSFLGISGNPEFIKKETTRNGKIYSF